MVTRKPLWMALGLSGLAIIATLRNARKVSQQFNRKQQSRALNTWENEGGNPPPARSASAPSAARSTEV